MSIGGLRGSRSLDHAHDSRMVAIRQRAWFRRMNSRHRLGIPPTNKKGGTISNGYFWIYMPSHHRARPNGYVKRAVLVLEQRLGRHLQQDEDSHHVNGDKRDDRDENLEVLTHAAHSGLHVTVAIACVQCGGPHRARGLCSACYMKAYRRNAQMPLEPSRGGGRKAYSKPVG